MSEQPVITEEGQVEVQPQNEGAAIQTPSTPEITPQVDQKEAASQDSKEADAVVPVESDIPVEGLKYAGFDVTLSIPKEMANFCVENGVDAEALTKELYASEDFKLSEESLAPLYEKFGKWQVDAFFEGINAKNQALLGQTKDQQATQAAQEKSAWDSTMQIMEGQDKWNDMSAWADKNLTPEEIAEFNQVMEKSTARVQSLMIKDLYSRFKQAGAPVAPTVLSLEEGGNDNTQTSQALSGAEYQKLLISGEYRKDPAKYDSMRRLGMQKGL